MPKPIVTIAGIKSLAAGLEALPAALAKAAVWEALKAGAAPVIGDARARVPVLSATDPAVQSGRRKPGTLKATISARRSKRNRGQAGLHETLIGIFRAKGRRKAIKAAREAGTISADDPYYWRWVEFGTSKMAARPFLRPAIHSARDAALAKMRDSMKPAIAKQAAKIAATVNAESRARR